MSDRPGNQTPDTPDLRESDLRRMKVDELRDAAKDEGVGAASRMRKDELVSAISQAHREAADDAGPRDDADRGPDGEAGAGAPGDAGPDGGHLRWGEQSSKSLKYSQEVISPDDEPERAGRSLATTSHEVIRQWAEERGGRPSTVDGTEHDGRAGVLRFDFGEHTDRLREISWDEWFETFDARGLNFIYQEKRSDGRRSTFFRLENPTREDA